tara:strand:+ start:2416 stop:2787 length:372 start_codon:yes stop_codon:yes gene_type:complete
MTEEISGTTARQQASAPRAAAAVVGGGARAQSTRVVETAQPDNSLDSAELQKRIEESVAELNQAVNNMNLSVEFSVDETINRQVVKVIDKDTGDVFMQLPSEAALNAAKNLDVMRGVLFDDSV